MSEFDLEDFFVSFILEKISQGVLSLKGEVFKAGTRVSINDEDVVVEVLSIDDRQFQNAVVSVKIFANDLNIGSPDLVPDVAKMQRISEVFEEVFSSNNSSYCLVTSQVRCKISSIKRERKPSFKQHCVNCLFDCTICNF